MALVLQVLLFFFFNLFIHLFLAVLGLCCSVWASHWGGFSCCRAWALGVRASIVVARGFQSAGSVVVACGLQSTGSVVVARRLSSCGAWA